MKSETILAESPNGTEPKKRPNRNYELIKKFILSQLLLNGEITLTDLFKVTGQNLSTSFGSEVNWHLLQVKMDLQSHGMIKVSFDPGCVQVIKLNPKLKNKVRMWLRNKTS
jgi:hypothetical protein